MDDDSKHRDGDAASVPDIKRVEVDHAKIAGFTSEEDFTELAVDLLVEITSFVCLAASLLPAGTRRWDRDRAIVVGNMVRLYKLLNGLLDQTCQRRREMSFIFSRLAFESIVNIAYLIEFSSPELFDSYVRYSLKHERRLHDRIARNIAARGGEEWPIERRMLNSIERAAKVSGIQLSQVSTSKPKNWGDKNLYERAEAVGLDHQYLGVFGGPSHTVHGNWMDLVEYHLDDNECGFTPELRWHRPRPQPLFVIGKLTVALLSRYLAYMRGEESAGPLDDVLDELSQRIHTADTLHEKFLTAKTRE